MLESNDTKMLALGMVMLLIALAGAAAGGSPPPGGGGGPPPGGKWELIPGQQSFTGNGQENSKSGHEAELNFTNLAVVTVTLSWQDEASTRFHTNEPDTLGVTVNSPEGEEKDAQATQSSGSVSVRYDFNVTNKTAAQKTSKRGMGNWQLTVDVGTCGDQEPQFIPSVIGLRTQPDNGNAYTLTISYSYYAKAKGAK